MGWVQGEQWWHQAHGGGQTGRNGRKQVTFTVKNNQVKELLHSTADKVEQLSAETHGELLATTRKRCTLENERSIRFQLVQGKAQVAERNRNNKIVTHPTVTLPLSLYSTNSGKFLSKKRKIPALLST